LGKIAALASIRRDVLTWLGGSATVIAGVFAILAYFGVNETIKSTVAEQIKKELEKRDDQIRKSTQDIFVNVGKAQKDQEQITNVLTESKTKLIETEVARGSLNQKLLALEESISKTNGAK
jgi:Icc-related predicted phosphoesterase